MGVGVEWAGGAGSELYVVEADESVGDGVDGEACGGAYLEFATDVAAVGHDGVDGDEECVGYFFVG